MKNYRLTLTFELQAVDDVDARQKTHAWFTVLPKPFCDKAKLQEIYDYKPPRKVKL